MNNKLIEDISNNSNFLLLIEIFKGNYNNIIDNDSFFMLKYPNEAPVLYSILSLNG